MGQQDNRAPLDGGPPRIRIEHSEDALLSAEAYQLATAEKPVYDELKRMGLPVARAWEQNRAPAFAERYATGVSRTMRDMEQLASACRAAGRDAYAPLTALIIALQKKRDRLCARRAATSTLDDVETLVAEERVQSEATVLTMKALRTRCRTMLREAARRQRADAANDLAIADLCEQLDRDMGEANATARGRLAR